METATMTLVSERKLSYESFSQSSDAGFRITAPSLQRLFIDSALALTDLMVKVDTIEEKDRRPIQAQATNCEDLMVAWLNEINSLFVKEKFFCRRIVFNHFDGKKIEATAFGELHNPFRHGSLPQVRTLKSPALEMGDLEDSREPENLFYARIFLTR
jgi:SHS2 domain-containing protein